MIPDHFWIAKFPSPFCENVLLKAFDKTNYLESTNTSIEYTNYRVKIILNSFKLFYTLCLISNNVVFTTYCPWPVKLPIRLFRLCSPWWSQ